MQLKRNLSVKRTSSYYQCYWRFREEKTLPGTRFAVFMFVWLKTLREKCPYLELFSSVFYRIRTEYGETLRISPYSVRMRGNADQNNSEYGHFLRSQSYTLFIRFPEINPLAISTNTLYQVIVPIKLEIVRA